MARKLFLRESFGEPAGDSLLDKEGQKVTRLGLDICTARHGRIHLALASADKLGQCVLQQASGE